MHETFPQLKARHIRERNALLQHYADARMIQADAARELDMPRTVLNEYIIRYGIHWPVKRQGRQKETT